MCSIKLDHGKNKMTFDPKGLEVKEGSKNVYVKYLKELEIQNGAILAPRDVAEDIQDKPVLVVNNLAEVISSAEYFKNRHFLTTQFVQNLEEQSSAYSAMEAQGQEGPAVEELVRSTYDDNLDGLAEDMASLTVGDSNASEPSETDLLADLFGNLDLDK
jgi:hypothetical protein